MKLIDAHIHLAELSSPESMIEEAFNVGVDKMVSSVIERGNLAKNIELKEKYRGRIYLVAGYMPGTWNHEEFIEWYERIEGSVIGIGEVGLDFWRDINAEQIKAQKEDFKAILEYAKSRDIPVVIHSRNAGKHAIEIVKLAGHDRVLFHAFDGSPRYARRTGYFFSIPPSIVRSAQKQRLVQALPVEQLLLETDAPALGPVKGEENKPANILVSLREISRIKNISLDRVAEITSDNAASLFGF